MTASELSAFEPKALWVARSFRGLTVSELAVNAGISRQIASAIENGSAPPYRPALLAMAGALRFPIDFFHKSTSVPEHGVFHFRKAASVPEHAINKAAAYAALFSSVVDSFGRFASFARVRLPLASPTDADAIEAAADAFRAAIGFRTDTPIANTIKAVEAAGVFVGTFAPGTMPIDGFAWYHKAPVIMLSRASPWSRRRFSTMHEAGHLILHRNSSPEDREAHANRFAGAVLVPRAVFHREFPKPLRLEFNWAALIAMKSRWGVSIQALVHRAYDLGVIDAVQYRTANIHISKYGWKTKEPGEEEPEEPRICTEFLVALRKRAQVGELCRATSLYVEDIELALDFPVENSNEISAIIPIIARSPKKNT